MDETDRLVYALALMVQKLAEAHRAELDGLLERVKQLEESQAALRAACIDLGVAEDHRNATQGAREEELRGMAEDL